MKLPKITREGSINKPWTATQLKRLKRYCERDLSWKEMSEKLGRTVHACKGAATRMGYHKFRSMSRERTEWTEKQIVDLVAMYNAYIPWKEIVKRVGHPYQSCVTKLKALRKAQKRTLS